MRSAGEDAHQALRGRPGAATAPPIALPAPPRSTLTVPEATRKLARAPASAPAKLALAYAYYGARQFGKAAQTARPLVRDKKIGLAARIVFGYSLVGDGLYAAGAAALQQTDDPSRGSEENGTRLYDAARVFWHVRDVAKAEVCYTKSTKYWPSRAEAWLGLGLCYAQRGDPARARAMFLIGAQKAKTPRVKARAYAFASGALRDLGKRSEGAALFEAACKLDEKEAKRVLDELVRNAEPGRSVR